MLSRPLSTTTRRPGVGHCLAGLLGLALCLGLVGCQLPRMPGDSLAHTDAAHPNPADDDGDRDRPAPVSVAVTPGMARLFPGWQPRPMPGKRWAPFELVERDGREGLQVHAHSSLSILSRRMDDAPRSGPAHIDFSWWVERDLPDARLVDAQASDSPARVAVSFAGDRSRFAPRDHILSELLLLMTGEPLPYATLVYVWANELTPGTVVPSPRTQRIRYLVVEQGPQRLRQWVSHRRDVQADFRRAFGEAPGPIVGLALMTDTDNTGTGTRAVYGPVRLLAP